MSKAAQAGTSGSGQVPQEPLEVPATAGFHGTVRVVRLQEAEVVLRGLYSTDCVSQLREDKPEPVVFVSRQVIHQAVPVKDRTERLTQAITPDDSVIVSQLRRLTENEKVMTAGRIKIVKRNQEYTDSTLGYLLVAENQTHGYVFFQREQDKMEQTAEWVRGVLPQKYKGPLANGSIVIFQAVRVKTVKEDAKMLRKNPWAVVNLEIINRKELQKWEVWSTFLAKGDGRRPYVDDQECNSRVEFVDMNAKLQIACFASEKNLDRQQKLGQRMHDAAVRWTKLTPPIRGEFDLTEGTNEQGQYKNTLKPKEDDLIVLMLGDEEDEENLTAKLMGTVFKIDIEHNQHTVKFQLDVPSTNEVIKQGLLFDDTLRYDVRPSYVSEGTSKLHEFMSGVARNDELWDSPVSAVLDLHYGFEEMTDEPTPAQPHEWQVPGLASANDDQLKLLQVIRNEGRPYVICEGPPGAGKSMAMAGVTYMLLKENPDACIYIVTKTNIAANANVEKFAGVINEQAGEELLRLVRITGRNQEALPADRNREFTLQYQSQNPDPDWYSFDPLSEARLKFTQVVNRYKELGELNVQDAERASHAQTHTERNQLVERLKRRSKDQALFKEHIEKEWLEKRRPNVVVTTLTSAHDERLANIRPTCILIDEAGQPLDAQILFAISLLTGDRPQIALVGDRFQLPPTVRSTGQARRILMVSSLERLEKQGILVKVQLRIIYRMHEFMTEFVSNATYGGVLVQGVSKEERQLPGDICIPLIHKDRPIVLAHVQGNEEVTVASSYANRQEVDLIVDILKMIMKHRNGKPLTLEDVRIMCMYDSQRAILTSKLTEIGLRIPADMVSSVDACQGEEATVTILSMVRSNPEAAQYVNDDVEDKLQQKMVGFLKDERRSNVANTRAKAAWVIVADAYTVGVVPYLRKLTRYCAEHGVAVQNYGDILKQVPEDPDAWYDDRGEIRANIRRWHPLELVVDCVEAVATAIPPKAKRQKPTPAPRKSKATRAQTKEEPLTPGTAAAEDLASLTLEQQVPSTSQVSVSRYEQISPDPQANSEGSSASENDMAEGPQVQMGVIDKEREPVEHMAAQMPTSVMIRYPDRPQSVGAQSQETQAARPTRVSSVPPQGANSEAGSVTFQFMASTAMATEAVHPAQMVPTSAILPSVMNLPTHMQNPQQMGVLVMGGPFGDQPTSTNAFYVRNPTPGAPVVVMPPLPETQEQPREQTMREVLGEDHEFDFLDNE